MTVNVPLASTGITAALEGVTDGAAGRVTSKVAMVNSWLSCEPQLRSVILAGPAISIGTKELPACENSMLVLFVSPIVTATPAATVGLIPPGPSPCPPHLALALSPAASVSVAVFALSASLAVFFHVSVTTSPAMAAELADRDRAARIEEKLIFMVPRVYRMSCPESSFFRLVSVRLSE